MKSSRVSLSRLAITGAVDSSTPSVVLTEIADAHSISWEKNRMTEPRYLAKLINTINTKVVNMVKEPYDMNDYKLIARFVNRNHQWKKGSLQAAFNLLLEYTDINKLSEAHLGFKFGPQTPENPDSLNACILYGICKVNRIDTRFDSSIDEMASNIEMLFSLRDQGVHHSIRTVIHEAMLYGQCEGYQLVNILSQIDPDRSIHIMNLKSQSNDTNHIASNIETTREIRITHTDLRLAASEIATRNIRTRPRTHVEAVAMAALYYKMDISKVSNPLAEYQELCRTPYLPIDRELARRLQVANKYPDSTENPHLDQVFNPEIPSNMYDDNDLIAMCLEEGYQNDDIREEGAYTLLQTSYLTPTFLHGKQGNIENNENTMLDAINDVIMPDGTIEEEGLEYNNVIVYGIRGNLMRAYSYGELTDVFRNYKRFQRPDGNAETFDDIVIQKLYTLCHKDQRTDESDMCFRERLALGEEIDRVRLYLQTNQAQVHDFVNRYEQYGPNEQGQIENFLTELLHCGMYMRSWSGEGPYPLSSVDTQTERDEQPVIDMRVTASIIQLESTIESLNQLDGLGDLIKELPLIFYHQRSGELLPSTNEEEGLTIVERINIVKGGEDGSLQSCIRMSSNRFCASAYFYMNLLRMDAPFNISDMAHIV